MQLLMTERARAFVERHEVIDFLRGQREAGGSLAIEPEGLHALLQEIDLLQVVAQSAEQMVGFESDQTTREPVAHLRNSLRRWKE